MSNNHSWGCCDTDSNSTDARRGIIRTIKQVQSQLIEIYILVYVGCFALLRYRRAMIMSFEEIVPLHEGTTISMDTLVSSSN
jgi:hypothetical protein